MLRLGIIVQRRKKESRCFFEKIKRKEINSENNPFELIVAEIPNVEEKTLQCQGKWLRKAERLLEKRGVDRVILSKALKEQCRILENDNIQKERNRLFLELTPLCIRKLGELCGMKILESKVCIRDNNPGRITEYLLGELCFETKRIELCTQDKTAAKKIRDEFYEDRGLLISVSDSLNKDCADIEIDVQKPSVRIGRDVVVDGVELGFDLGESDVDSLEVAVALKGVNAAERISSYLLGKKKLTLS